MKILFTTESAPRRRFWKSILFALMSLRVQLVVFVVLALLVVSVGAANGFKRVLRDAAHTGYNLGYTDGVEFWKRHGAFLSSRESYTSATVAAFEIE